MTERQCISLKLAAVRAARALARRIDAGEVIGPGEVEAFKGLADVARWQPSALADSSKLRDLDLAIQELRNQIQGMQSREKLREVAY